MNTDAEQQGLAGRARHSVRAVFGLQRGGAHGMMRPTFGIRVHPCLSVVKNK